MIKLNGEIITPTIFSDKTSQVWKLRPLMPYTIQVVEWDFESEAEVMQIVQLKMLLDKELPTGLKRLDMSYLPYARQDKDISNESTFALHSFAHIINSLNFNKVTALDAHSRVASTLIKNFEDVFPDNQIGLAIDISKSNMLLFPDKGAAIRYGNKFTQSYIIANKVRNQLTGHIDTVDIDFNNNKMSNLDNILIVDDICDGGMTFQLVTQQLVKLGFTNINLYVTHGIFSKGTQVLRDAGVKRIFTKNGEVNE